MPPAALSPPELAAFACLFPLRLVGRRLHFDHQPGGLRLKASVNGSAADRGGPLTALFIVDLLVIMLGISLRTYLFPLLLLLLVHSGYYLLQRKGALASEDLLAVDYQRREGILVKTGQSLPAATGLRLAHGPIRHDRIDELNFMRVLYVQPTPEALLVPIAFFEHSVSDLAALQEFAGLTELPLIEVAEVDLTPCS